jgi:hypothetical protein
VRFLGFLVLIVGCQSLPSGGSPPSRPATYPMRTSHVASLPSRRHAPPARSAPPAASTYTSAMVAIRTSLGRAAIGLDLEGSEPELRTSPCDDPSAPRSSCAHCALVAAGDDFTLDLDVLHAIKAAFDRYPTRVLDTTKIQRVALCTRLYEEPDDRIAGTVDPARHLMLVSVEQFAGRRYLQPQTSSPEDLVHHELYHLLEAELLPGIVDDDPPWRAINSPEFDYHGFVHDSAHASVAGAPPPGFVNSYATTNAAEDRASVFQLLMAQPAALCKLAASDPAIRDKVRLLWRRVAAVVDDGFLRRRAACAIELAPPAAG